MQSSLRTAGLIAVVFAAAIPPARAATGYTFNLLPPPRDVCPVGSAAPSGMSQTGVVLGYCTTFSQGRFNTYGIRWEGSEPVSLATLGTSNATPQGLNNIGTAVGHTETYDQGRLLATAVAWDADGAIRTLPALRKSDTTTVALAVNDKGVIAGNGRSLLTGVPVAILWKDGKPKKLATPAGADGAIATAISNSGWVAGAAVTVDERFGLRETATLWRNGIVHPLESSPDESSLAVAVNDSGAAAGSVYGVRGYTPALWKDGVRKTLGTLGLEAWATAINKKGAVVGYAWVLTSPTVAESRGMLWQGDKAINLNSKLDVGPKAAGWIILDAVAIDDAGKVVGSAYNSITTESSVYEMVPSQ